MKSFRDFRYMTLICLTVRALVLKLNIVGLVPVVYRYLNASIFRQSVQHLRKAYRTAKASLDYDLRRLLVFDFLVVYKSQAQSLFMFFCIVR